MKTALPYLLIGLSIGLFYMHIDPIYKEVEVLQSKKTEYGAALAKADELQAQKVRILDTYNAIPKSDLDRLNRLLPEKLNSVKLVADIDGVAGKYGITIANIKVVEEVVDRAQQVATTGVEKPYLTTAVDFKFSATYENMVRFIADLERSLQLIDIQTITFQTADTLSAGQNSAAPVVSTGLNDYQISFQTYSIK